MIVYRICKAAYAKAAFAGAGGLNASGRWHHKGQPIAYAAANLALAALEYLVHLGRHDVKMRFVSVHAMLPDDISLEAVDAVSLPKNWNAAPPLDFTMALGSRWCAELRTAVLKVPSAVVSGEFNYLLNPKHHEFRRIEVSKPERFFFDPRLWK